MSDLLDGFEIKATPASTYTALVATNIEKGELYIQFRPSKKEIEAGIKFGAQFFYSPVDPLLLHQLMTAESTGKFYNREIKPNYTATAITDVVFTELPLNFDFNLRPDSEIKKRDN